MYADDRVIEGIEVAGGSALGVEVPAPQRGMLFKLVVAQLGGDLEGFTYTLFNKREACPPGPAPGAAATAPRALHRVAGPCTVGSGKATFEAGASYAYNGAFCLYIPFQCLDAPGVHGARDYSLYLEVAAAGTGPKTFGAALTIGATSPE